MKRHFLIALVGAMLAFAGTAAYAADGMDNMDNGVWSSMDANSDGQVSENEFNTYYADTDLFVMWDTNDDGWIDQDELGTAWFSVFDGDDDGYIDDAEWQNGFMVDDYGDAGFWDM